MGAAGLAVVRIVWGTGTGPTVIASYDAALGAAGVGDYNLARVSSILPADADITEAGVAPDLGPVGNRLWVVEARATAEGPDRAGAGLAWTVGPGPGVFYEVGRSAAGDEHEVSASVADELDRGLSACMARREWRFEDEERRIVTAAADPGAYATAVVLGVFGASESIW